MKKNLIFSALLPVLIFAFALYGTEAVFKWNARRHPAPVNGWDQNKLYTWGHLVTGTEFVHKKAGQPDIIKGYRQKPFSSVKPVQRFRIEILGDSYTFGEGIAQEDMYANRLETLLKAAYPKVDVEVINFGLRGADTVFEKYVLETTINSVKPDLIIVGFCSNDPKQKGEEYSAEREAFYARHGETIKQVAAGLSKAGLSKIGGRFETMVDNLLPVFGIAPDWATRFRNAYDKNGKEWAEFVEALKGIKNLSDQKRLPPPYFAVLTTGLAAEETIYFHQAEDAAKAAGFRTLNFENEIRTTLQGQPLSAPWGGHASKELNEEYAKKLFSLVRKDLEYYFLTKNK